MQMRLRKKQIYIKDIIIYILLLSLSGFFFAIQTTPYILSKITAMLSVAFFIIVGLRKKIRIDMRSHTYDFLCIEFVAITLVIAFYSVISHDQSLLGVFNICGGYFGVLAYIIMKNIGITKDRLVEIWLWLSFVILIIFFAQYAIFILSGKIIFVDFNNPRMRAGFLRAGVGETFFSICIVLVASKVIKEYKDKRKFDKKLVLYLALLTCYFVMFICTRADMLSMAISILCVIFFASRSFKVKAASVLAIIVCICIAAYTGIVDKYLSIDLIEGGGSINGRLEMYKYYLEGFLNKPLLGNGFLYPSNQQIKELLYGRSGFYYLEDVGIVGFIFTTGVLGLIWLAQLISTTLKNIIYLCKKRSLFDEPEVLGLTVYFLTTLPTLLIFDYSRVGYFPFLMYLITPNCYLIQNKAYVPDNL